MQLPEHTNDLFTINRAVAHAIKNMFKEKIDYKKTGVILMEIIPQQSFKPDLFTYHLHREKREALGNTLDKISARYGKNTISIGLSCFGNRNWSMSQAMKSQNYVTNWNELRLVN